MNQKNFKVIELVLILFLQFACSSNPIYTDSKSPPPQDQTTQGAAGLGLMMNLVNLATGNLVKSKTDIHIHFSMKCISDRFSLELKSNEKRVYYKEFSLAQQSKIQVDVVEGQYQLILKKITVPYNEIKTQLNITAKDSQYSITACD